MFCSGIWLLDTIFRSGPPARRPGGVGRPGSGNVEVTGRVEHTRGRIELAIVHEEHGVVRHLGGVLHHRLMILLAGSYGYAGHFSSDIDMGHARLEFHGSLREGRSCNRGKSSGSNKGL